METNVTQAARIAQAAIKYVGEYLVVKQREIAQHQRTGRRDLIREMDKEVGMMVQKFLGAEFPEHGFVSEEVKHKEHAQFVWHVDPIDGTRHYVRGLPFYSVSLALCEDGVPVLGVVYAPASRELFSAIVEEGAYCNDERIAVSDVSSLEQALLCVEFPTTKQKDFAGSLKVLEKMAKEAMRVRALGYSSLGICYVAKGGFDGYLDFSNTTKKIDYVAAELILKEAGGMMELLGSDSPVEVFASNEELYEKIREMLLI